MSKANGLRCPKCGGTKLPVDYTRGRDGGTQRRRKCKACGEFIPTHEAIIGAAKRENSTNGTK